MVGLWASVVILAFSCTGLCSALQCKKQHIYNNYNRSNDYNNTEHKIKDANYHPCYRTCEYPAKPKICEYEFTVNWSQSMSGYCFDCPLNPDNCNLKNCLAIDGHPRMVIVTNGMTPGPSIQVCHGDTIRVKLNNRLHDHGGLTIHWHGLHQNGTNWMDGVSMITQCPVPFATSFVYEFLAKPAGTHWWHGHSGFYRADGMYGSLIVRNPREQEKNQHLYDLDLAEHVMIVTDWSKYIGLEEYISQTTSTELPPVTQQTILINGKGRGRAFTDTDGSIVYTARSVFHVKAGLRYRFRVISSAIAACNIQVSVDGHFMLIIATDGSEVSSIKVDSFIIASGERYDFVISGSAVPRPYLIRVTGLSNACPYTGDALLCYRDAPCIDPTLNPMQLSPNHRIFSAFPKEHNINKKGISEVLNLFDTYSLDFVDPDLDSVDSTHYVTFSFLTTTVFDEIKSKSFSISIPKVNNVGFSFPQTPVLLKTPNDICEPHFDNALMERCQNTDCYCTNILKLKLGEVVEFVIANFESDTFSLDHPTHIHGQSARIVGLGLFDGKPKSLDDVKILDKAGNLTRISSKDAVSKDTVIVPGNGYVIMKWKAVNPGIWFFHCHIENHLENGMAMVVQVGEDDEIPRPPDDFPTCGSWPSST